jgi:hypothetical protein
LLREKFIAAHSGMAPNIKMQRQSNQDAENGAGDYSANYL